MGSTFHSQYSTETLSPGKGKFCVPKRMTINKRKFHDDSNINNTGNSTNSYSNFNIKNRIIKRQRNPNEIFGQKLSLNRIIETLSKEKLQDLINNLILENPELTNKLINASPIITPEDSITELKRKLNSILSHLPYKVESSSDYAFLRVKPLVNEFFQSLSDYSLNFLPPIENDLIIPITFLKKILLEVLYKLPQFNAVEFRYFYNLTIEKFNLIFNNLIIQFLNEKKQNLLLIINENWIDDFKKINDLNNNSFIKIQNLLQIEIDSYYQSGSIIKSSESNDINKNINNSLTNNSNINNDNKLAGLDNLLNFAYQNNPLSTTNNI